ncbi:MAG: hypothetical protein JSW11_00230 [Candidatus Heimdallarchaeota archaeon]|nr:MAG: hypothetical protein JSW11_00230 [Candidatus Heimdallarchaeota archaeon]
MDIKDFFVEIQKNKIPEHFFMHKFGRNDEIPNGSWAIISPSAPSGAFPTSGVRIRIKAGGSTNDIVNGTGAREVTIIGINTDLIETTENIVTSGENTSLSTTNRFWRIYRAYVSCVGTYWGANDDDIILEDEDSINDMLTIKAGEGQTQHGAYSIANNRKGYLSSIHITSDALKAADFRLFIRDSFNQTTPPVCSKRIKLFFDGILGSFIYKPVSPGLILNPLSDIWVEARGAGAGTEVSVDFEILLVNDPSGPIKTI